VPTVFIPCCCLCKPPPQTHTNFDILAGGNEDGTAIDFTSKWATLYDNVTYEPIGSAHVFAPTFTGSMADMFLEVKVKRLDYPRFVDINLQVRGPK
jgi:hypothetical protein